MLEGWEWIIIGVVAIVIIMWGPAKIPQFARALGQAKGEFSKASKEFNDAASQESSGKPAPAKNIKTKDEMLLETAQKLGISTEGKTREQISEEISVKVKILGAE
jgi:sec-independent protein translocase protein TatA